MTLSSIMTRPRTIVVRAVFPNDRARLLPGMLMTVGIESNKRQSLSVAEQTLVPIETRQYVYVAEGEEKADRREVKTGARIPGFVEILSGLGAQAVVVTDGGNVLRDGVSVQPVAAGAAS